MNADAIVVRLCASYIVFLISVFTGSAWLIGPHYILLGFGVGSLTIASILWFIAWGMWLKNGF